MRLSFLCLFLEVIVLVCSQNGAQSDEEIEDSKATESLKDVNRFLYGMTMSACRNNKTDPCEDFYEYACGNYFNVFAENPFRKVFGSMAAVSEQLGNNINDILSEPVNADRGSLGADDKAKIYYQSCMRESIFQYKASEPYLKLINSVGGWPVLVDSIGGWPVLKADWKDGDFDWFNAVIKFKSLGINFIIEEIYWSSHMSSLISVPTIGLSKMSPNSLRRPYSREFQKNRELAMHLMMRYGVSKRKAAKTFEEIVAFGKELEVWRENSKIQSPRYDILTLDEFYKLTPKLDWKSYFSLQSNPLVGVVIMPNKKFIQGLPNLFKGKNLRRAANYYILKLLYELHDEIRHIREKQTYCVDKVQSAMGDVIVAMFLASKHHDKEIESDILVLTSYIRDAFRDSIKSARWINKIDKKIALKKVQSIEVVVGSSDLDVDLDELHEKYANLAIHPNNSFYDNVLIMLPHIQEYLAKNLGGQRLEVNAQYRPDSNSLLLMPGLFRRPLYEVNFPKAYNFGYFGSVIGHEFTHALDSVDEIGKASREEFLKRSKCFMSQYSKYRIKELNKYIQGDKTILENISDNGGVRHSFYGYKKWLRSNKDVVDPQRLTLNGLNMTDDQLFFLSYAQGWCEKRRGFHVTKAILQDEHSPAKWRIIGSLSNFDEFSNAFNCKPKSKMNPNRKCIIW